ncbi:hypothetical protein ASPZODRAFT_134235 [Penicilliopsis zonata CBS 506.65]|uniref:DNA double-strand break repair and VJ recombination XRCC4 n=1 Tax=Penicilliopsis zonata CBS 506.65 TaxID=1073090 RepID=A0A1L9SCA6_9EURO|nr:hypothetical protein ASPZODRAFT_134235 [Penicilliopsis zonata CBS 506.65]OJJ44845.1 hypothetical protein ASPZODRAFT_134235 [Penicilliopsis zonata CBS 506.65]
MDAEPFSPRRIVRIPLSDEPEAYVLLDVVSSDRSHLNLKITATEGENPFVGTVKEADLGSFRAKNYSGNEEEWVQIVSYVFGQIPSSSPSRLRLLSGLSVSATTSDTGNGAKKLAITIRKKIEDITQRLGTITLYQDDEQAIELFDWSGVAVAQAERLEKQIASLIDRCQAAEDGISKLNIQLEELISAKGKHESQLVANFLQLLNEKKLKIRNQQRLLSSATMDPDKVNAVKAAAAGRPRKPSGKRQSTKRGASALDDDEIKSEDEFEQMDVDRSTRAEDQETDGDQPQTPQPLETEEDTSADEEYQKPTVEEAPIQSHRADAQVTSKGLDLKNPSTAPPPRELPFARRYTKQSTLQSTIQSQSDLSLDEMGRETDAGETDAGETDDDEL